MTHELKTWPVYFSAVEDGTKKFEFRYDSDRDFNLGDNLYLREWDPENRVYTGRSVTVKITYILKILGTHVIMSIERIQ